MTKIKNLKELIHDLSAVYAKLREKEIPLNEAKEIANMAGKIIKATAVQLQYNEYMQNKAEIDFCENK